MCAMSMAFSKTPQCGQSNSMEPYTGRQEGSSSSGTKGMGGRSSAGRDLEPQKSQMKPPCSRQAGRTGRQHLQCVRMPSAGCHEAAYGLNSELTAGSRKALTCAAAVTACTWCLQHHADCKGRSCSWQGNVHAVPLTEGQAMSKNQTKGT